MFMDIDDKVFMDIDDQPGLLQIAATTCVGEKQKHLKWNKGKNKRRRK